MSERRSYRGGHRTRSPDGQSESEKSSLRAPCPPSHSRSTRGEENKNSRSREATSHRTDHILRGEARNQNDRTNSSSRVNSGEKPKRSSPGPTYQRTFPQPPGRYISRPPRGARPTTCFSRRPTTSYAQRYNVPAQYREPIRGRGGGLLPTPGGRGRGRYYNRGAFNNQNPAPRGGAKNSAGNATHWRTPPGPPPRDAEYFQRDLYGDNDGSVNSHSKAATPESSASATPSRRESRFSALDPRLNRVSSPVPIMMFVAPPEPMGTDQTYQQSKNQALRGTSPVSDDDVVNKKARLQTALPDAFVSPVIAVQESSPLKSCASKSIGIDSNSSKKKSPSKETKIDYIRVIDSGPVTPPDSDSDMDVFIEEAVIEPRSLDSTKKPHSTNLEPAASGFVFIDRPFACERTEIQSPPKKRQALHSLDGSALEKLCDAGDAAVLSEKERGIQPTTILEPTSFGQKNADATTPASATSSTESEPEPERMEIVIDAPGTSDDSVPMLTFDTVGEKHPLGLKGTQRATGLTKPVIRRATSCPPCEPKSTNIPGLLAANQKINVAATAAVSGDMPCLFFPANFSVARLSLSPTSTSNFYAVNVDLTETRRCHKRFPSLPYTDSEVDFSHLDTYETPKFLADHLIAHRNLVSRHPRAHPDEETLTARVITFYETLDFLDSTHLVPGTLQYENQLQLLSANLDAVLQEGAWFQAAETASNDQLGVLFLRIIKVCFQEQLHEFPNVGTAQPYPNATKFSLEMLWKAILEVENLAVYMTQLSLPGDLVELAFSSSIPASWKALACSLLEIYFLRASPATSLINIGDQLRKNSIPLLNDKLSRVLRLFDLRKAVQAPLESTASVSDAMNQQILADIVFAIRAYRKMCNPCKPDTLTLLVDIDAAVYVCLARVNFLSWFVTLLQNLAARGAPESLRSSQLLTRALEFLHCMLEDVYGPVFLAQSANHLSVLLTALDSLAILTCRQDVMDVTKRLIWAVSTCSCLELLSREATSTDLVDIYRQLTVLVWDWNFGGTAVRIISRPSCLQTILLQLQRDYLSVTAESAVFVINALVCQFHKVGITFVISNLPDEFLLNRYLGASLSCIRKISGVMPSSDATLQRSFPMLVSEMEGALSLMQQDGYIEMLHVVLDALVFLQQNGMLSASNRVLSLLDACDPVPFLAQVLRTIQQFFDMVIQSPERFVVPCLRMWESIWVNAVRLICWCILVGHVPVPVACQLLMETISLLSKPDLPVREAVKDVIRKELTKGFAVMVRETFNTDDMEKLISAPLVQTIWNSSTSAVKQSGSAARMVVYLMLLNILHPADLHIINDSKDDVLASFKEYAIEALQTRRKNWDSAVRLDYLTLQHVIVYGLYMKSKQSDVEFRLWFWRYSEMSAVAAYEIVSMLLVICHSAIFDEISHDVLAPMVQKISALLKISTVRMTALRLLDLHVFHEDSDLQDVATAVGWEAGMFTSIINLVRDTPICIGKSGGSVLLAATRVLVALLDVAIKWSASKPEDVYFSRSREIAAAVMVRLQKDASVPVIICLLPVLERLFNTDHGVRAFLKEIPNKPVLNWILVGLARELQSDPEARLPVRLARRAVRCFLNLAFLSKNGCRTRRVSPQDLRGLADMVIAYTRDFDKDKPNYRIPQHRDPLVLCSGNAGEDHVLSSSVTEFKDIVLNGVTRLSRLEDTAFDLREADTCEVEELPTAFKEQYGQSVFAGVFGEKYADIQRSEIEFHMFTEQEADLRTDQRFMLNEDVEQTRLLKEWLDKKSGEAVTC